MLLVSIYRSWRDRSSCTRLQASGVVTMSVPDCCLLTVKADVAYQKRQRLPILTLLGNVLSPVRVSSARGGGKRYASQMVVAPPTTELFAR
jgi:hypothetical protein